ncbi:MAG TPA: restriction endonuclease [Ktedonobacteraceae bacterium]
MRVPPGFLIGGSIAVLVVILLCIIIWVVLRSRPTLEEMRWHQEQRMAVVQMQETAQTIGVRPVELSDLAQLTNKEFEYFTGALLEAMGVLFEWECVGGASDRGIDLRGKNQYGQPLIVQCKQFFGYNVAPKFTREFGGTMGLHRANEGWFVTTTLFSAQARADVQHLTLRGYIKLVDGNTLVDFIHDHWNALPEQWQWRLTECMLKSNQ